MKSPSSKQSFLAYSPKTKAFAGSSYSKIWSTCRHPIAILALVAFVLYVSVHVGISGRVGAVVTRLHGGSDPNMILLNVNDVKASKCAKFSRLINFTTEEYQELFFQDPGKERYCLISHMAELLHGQIGDFVDVGTRVAASALSLMSHGHSVTTIDIPTSIELDHMVRKNFGLSIKEWKSKIEQSCATSKLTIVKAKLLSLDENSTHWQTIRRSPLIFLDTFHKPNSKPFEREFIKRLVDIKYSGLVLIDDIYLNFEMQKLFDELVCTDNVPYNVYDLTVVGHSSGTGLLDFEYNRKEKEDSGGYYHFVVGASDERLAEKAKKFSFLKGGGQLQRFRETQSDVIPIQFLPLKCENL